MGKGDRRSKRGKIWRGTSGKTRPKMKKRTPRPPQPDERAMKRPEVSDQVSVNRASADLLPGEDPSQGAKREK
jgi:30S ribosomal protein S31